MIRRARANLLVYPTDFTEFQVGDRVIILKDVTTTKTSQLWNDDDMKVMGGVKY